MNMAETTNFDAKAAFLAQHLKTGETYAGLLLGKNGEPDRHVILLAGTFRGNHQDAIKWAKKQGGELPSRRAQSLLFANLAELFEKAWYWSSEQLAGHPDYAWVQDFGNGHQHYDRMSYQYRAVAVRSLIL